MMLQETMPELAEFVVQRRAPRRAAPLYRQGIAFEDWTKV